MVHVRLWSGLPPLVDHRVCYECKIETFVHEARSRQLRAKYGKESWAVVDNAVNVSENTADIVWTPLLSI